MESEAQSNVFENQDLSNQLWWMAAQSAVPPQSVMFPEQSFNGFGITPPPEILSKYHQNLLAHHGGLNFPLISELLTQYPSDSQSGFDYHAFAFSKDANPSSLDMFSDLDDLLSPTNTSFDTMSVVENDYDTIQHSATPEFSDEEPQSKRARRSNRKSSTKSDESSRRKSSSGSKSGSSGGNIDRIRERNRISAQRFRDKKKADAIDLELRTEELSAQREELVKEITDLQWQSILLQEQCLRSVMCKCDDMRGFFKNNAIQHGSLCVSETKT